MVDVIVTDEFRETWKGRRIMKTHCWNDLKKKNLTKKQIKAIDQKVIAEILEMDLRALRELLGKTQEELATITKMTQSEISRLERRADYKLSTMRRIVKALGGELEVVANFGDKQIKLHAVG